MAVNSSYNKSNINQEKTRLDIFILRNGFVETRNRGQTLIREGNVLVNNQVVKKCGHKVTSADHVEIIENIIYVGRGGKKLEYAIDAFSIDVNGKVCLDIGSSTGGFTQCLLIKGASEVYSVDCGEGQLHETLKNDRRVKLFENTDIRDFYFADGNIADIITIDVSFISLSKVLPLCKGFLNNGGQIIALFKPQFQCGPGAVDRRGIVSDIHLIKKSIDNFVEEFSLQGFKFISIIPSKVKGVSGTTEYFMLISLA